MISGESDDDGDIGCDTSDEEIAEVEVESWGLKGRNILDRQVEHAEELDLESNTLLHIVSKQSRSQEKSHSHTFRKDVESSQSSQIAQIPDAMLSKWSKGSS